MLVEVIKLLHYAGASDVTAFRLGTSGGVGVEAGTVVLSTLALNGELQEYHIQYILGKKVNTFCTSIYYRKAIDDMEGTTFIF